MAVHQGKDANGQRIAATGSSNAVSAQWDLIYDKDAHIDDANHPTEGLVPGKQFRLITQMRSGRALTRVGAQVKLSELDKANNN